MHNLIILNYHHFLPTEETEHSDRFTLDWKQFTAQLDTIASLQIPVVDLKQAWKPTEKEGNLSIALTFDDGYLSHFELVSKELLKRKIPATFFPIVNCMNQPGYMTYEHVKELKKVGFDIGSHGLSHRNLLTLNSERLTEEILESKRILEEALQMELDFFSLPYGAYSSRVLQVLKPIYPSALTTKSMVNSEDSPFLLHRFNVKKSWSPSYFQSLLKGKRQILGYQKWTSRLALVFHKVKAGFHRIFFRA